MHIRKLAQIPYLPLIGFLFHKPLPLLRCIAARALSDTVRKCLRIHINHVQITQKVAYPQFLFPIIDLVLPLNPHH